MDEEVNELKIEKGIEGKYMISDQEAIKDSYNKAT